METKTINTLPQRDESGNYPAYAWLGGYPLYYLCQDGGILCAGAECANGPESKTADEYDPQWHIIATDVHWKGESMVCDHCGGAIESAYGTAEN